MSSMIGFRLDRMGCEAVIYGLVRPLPLFSPSSSLVTSDEHGALDLLKIIGK